MLCQDFSNIQVYHSRIHTIIEYLCDVVCKPHKLKCCAVMETKVACRPLFFARFTDVKISEIGAKHISSMKISK